MPVRGPNELDDCVTHAHDLGETHEPFEAITAWIDRYIALVATKHGLAEALQDPAYEGLPQALMDVLQPVFGELIHRGVSSGVIRPDVTAREILVTVALLSRPVPGEDAVFDERLVRLFVEGLGTR